MLAGRGKKKGEERVGAAGRGWWGKGGVGGGLEKGGKEKGLFGLQVWAGQGPDFKGQSVVLKLLPTNQKPWKQKHNSEWGASFLGIFERAGPRRGGKGGGGAGGGGRGGCGAFDGEPQRWTQLAQGAGQLRGQWAV